MPSQQTTQPAPIEPGGVYTNNPNAGKTGFDRIGDMPSFANLPMFRAKPGAAAPAGPWQPYSPPSAASNMDWSKIYGMAGGGGGSGGGGGGGGWTHNPQPNYMPTYNTTGGGAGFTGGTGWAGTSVAGYQGAYDGNGGETGGSSLNGFVGTGSPGFGFANWKRQQAEQGGGGPMSGLINEFQRAQDAAVKANEDRYNNIVGGYQDRWQRNMERLAGIGDQQKADMNEQYDTRGANIGVDQISRGLSNTTVTNNLEADNEERRNDDMRRLQASLNRELIGYDTGLQGDLLQFMGQREDSYPQLEQVTQLAKMLGMAGGSSGGSGGAGLVSPMVVNGVGPGGGFGPGNMGGGNGGGNGGGGGFGNGGGPFTLEDLLAQLNGGGQGPNGPPAGLNPYQQMLWNNNKNGIGGYDKSDWQNYNLNWFNDKSPYSLKNMSMDG